MSSISTYFSCHTPLLHFLTLPHPQPLPHLQPDPHEQSAQGHPESATGSGSGAGLVGAAGSSSFFSSCFPEPNSHMIREARARRTMFARRQRAKIAKSAAKQKNRHNCGFFAPHQKRGSAGTLRGRTGVWQCPPMPFPRYVCAAAASTSSANTAVSPFAAAMPPGVNPSSLFALRSFLRSDEAMIETSVVDSAPSPSDWADSLLKVSQMTSSPSPE